MENNIYIYDSFQSMSAFAPPLLRFLARPAHEHGIRAIGARALEHLGCERSVKIK